MLAQGGTAPTATAMLPNMNFQGTAIEGYAEYYVNKMTGWIVPPVSGDYVFYISSDDEAAVCDRGRFQQSGNCGFDNHAAAVPAAQRLGCLR